MAAVSSILAAGALGLGAFSMMSAADIPTVDSSEADETVAEAEERASKVRTQLFETEGGILGEQLSEDDVAQRDTIFGN